MALLQLLATRLILLVDRFNILIIALTCCGLLEMVFWTSVSSQAGVFVFTILFGFFTGIYEARYLCYGES
jgi:hypothetical protein